MASSPASPSPEAEATFACNFGFFDDTMIGIGATNSAGIFVISGTAALGSRI